MKDLIVGTAGHIDHGKTTLLKSLTGIDADRLQEEKRRGITIDIGFAHLQLGDYRVGFVDVPGHEKFVKNMLAGIGGIHLALLVVAADESVMPQTVEHFHICRLLEIPRGVIALTKKNLVEAELLPLVEEEVRELVAGSFLEKAPAVAVDSISGEGVEELKAALLNEIEQLSRESAPRIFRLPIDRVFTMHGFGTIVTGTLWSGEVRKEGSVCVYPAGKEGKVRGIEIFNQKAEVARAGQRTALNLTGLERHQLERGMVLSRPGLLRPSYMVDALLHLLSSSVTLKDRHPVRFHHGSAELMGRVRLLEGEALKAGQSGLVQLSLDRPTVCCPGDHFILRRYSPVTTIGGGVILDGGPSRHGKNDLDQALAGLRTLAEQWQKRSPAFHASLLDYLVQSRGAEGVSLAELVRRTGWLEDSLLQVLKSLNEIVLVSEDPVVAVSRKALGELKLRITRFLEQFHARNPLAAGAPREELKKRFLRNAGGSYFQFLLEELEKEGQIEADAATVVLRGRRAELAPEQKKIRTALLELFQRTALQPPSLDELVQELPHPAGEVRDVYHFLLRQGELVKVSGEIVLLSGQADFLVAQLRRSFPKGEAFTVAEFKDLFGITRKYAIPYLEFLDRERVTRRMGDKRVVL